MRGAFAFRRFCRIARCEAPHFGAMSESEEDPRLVSTHAESSNLMNPAGRRGPVHDLVVGLVGAVGTDLVWVQRTVTDHLSGLGFQVFEVSLSALIDHEYGSQLPDRESLPYDEYVGERMTAGNVLRRHWERPTAVALLAVERLRMLRDQWLQENGSSAPACAFVLRSLKRPEEARALRNIYRGQFVLVGCHTPREIRIRQLADQIAKTRNAGEQRTHRSQAEALADRDEHERGRITMDPEVRDYFEDYGQSVEETFPLSDAYINLQHPAAADAQLKRFCDVLLGSPFVSPSRDEVAMFHARAAAMRSADLSRQVGASIATPEGDIIAVGCNEVPRAGGGAYWEGDTDDGRDFHLGIDGNQDQRDRAIREVFAVLAARSLLSPEAAKAGPDKFVRTLDDTRVDGLIEFTRAAHAEMAALLDAARRGTSVHGATLYTSTFPCHNCAKHIVSAGIGRVVFIEPYPKSLAEQLHGDAIAVDEPFACAPKVRFEHFAGIDPRNYFALFEATSKRKDGDGSPRRFSAATIEPKLRGNFHPDVFPFEEEAIRSLEALRISCGSPTPDMLRGAPQITDGDATQP